MNGFTLVELLCTMMIIALLAAFMVPSLLGFIEKSRKKAALVEAQGVKRSVELYLLDNYAGQQVDAMLIVDRLSRYGISSRRNPLQGYMVVNCSRGASLDRLTLDVSSGKVLEMTYSVNDFRIGFEEDSENGITWTIEKIEDA